MPTNEFIGYNLPNENRVIDITPTIAITGNPKHDSWRNNISYLFGWDKSGVDTKDGELLLNKGSSDDWTFMDVDGDVKLIMDKEPKVFRTGNSFGKPVEKFMGQNKVLSSASQFLSVGADIFSAIKDFGNDVSKTWMPWGKNILAWEGSSTGISFEYEFNFRMGQYGMWNAEKEVVKPILNLVFPAIPRNIGTFTMTGPFPNVYNLITNLTKKFLDTENKAPAQNNGGTGDTSKKSENSELTASETGGLLKGISENISSFLLSSYEKYTYTVKFGKMMEFRRMVLKDATAAFSNEVDQNGMPIAGTATLTFEGIIPLSLSSFKGTDSGSSLLPAKFNAGFTTRYNS